MSFRSFMLTFDPLFHDVSYGSGLVVNMVAHPLNPACSCTNLPKSRINVSIASFICRCLTDTQTGSSSVNSACFVSFPPTVFVYVYLIL